MSDGTICKQCRRYVSLVNADFAWCDDCGQKEWDDGYTQAWNEALSEWDRQVKAQSEAIEKMRKTLESQRVFINEQRSYAQAKEIVRAKECPRCGGTQTRLLLACQMDGVHPFHNERAAARESAKGPK